jgi:TAT (twin-arginine translocation) pathway signal sequence
LEKPLRSDPSHVSQKSLKENKKTDEKFESEQESNNKLSRRDFLKYGVGVAAVAAGATALMGKIPTLGEQQKAPAANDSAEPIVASVSGDQVTVMNGQVSVKVRDSGLAAQIADKLRAGN